MDDKSRSNDEKLEDSIEKLNLTIREISSSINKFNFNSEILVYTIKELDKDTRRGNKILSGLTFMLLGLTIIEAIYVLKPNNGIEIIFLAVIFFIFWLIGSGLLIFEGVGWIGEWIISKIKNRRR